MVKSWFLLVACCAADAGEHNHPATPTQERPREEVSAALRQEAKCRLIF